MEEMTEYLRMQYRLLLTRFSRNLRHILDNKLVIYYVYTIYFSIPINSSTTLYLFGGIEWFYMFDYNAQIAFFARFQDTLENMLYDLQNEWYTIGEIINYYSTLDILQDLTLVQRYNYNISVSETDLGNEDENEEREEEGTK